MKPPRLPLAWIAVGCSILTGCQRSEPRAPHELMARLRKECVQEAQLCFVLRDELKELEIREIDFWLDHQHVFSGSMSSSTKELILFSGDLAPGEHTISISLEGRHKLSSGLHFEAQTGRWFDIAAAKGHVPDRITVVATDAGPSTTAIEGRLQIRVIEDTVASRDRAQRIPSLKIWAARTGDIELDGHIANLEAVEKAIDHVALKHGSAIYAIESSDGEMHAHGVKIFAELAEKQVRVRLSARRDFSDVIPPATR